MEKKDDGHDPVTERIIASAIEVHSELGPGLPERPYVIALGIALKGAGMAFEMERPFPIMFRGNAIGDYRPDLIVEDHAVVEVKSVERYDPVFLAQMLTYLRVTGKHVGLIINFNRPRLVDGVKRVVL